MQFDYYYDDDIVTPYGNNNFGSNTVGMIGAGMMFGLLTIVCLYAVIVWILRSIGLYHLAKDRGISHAWFAWIPILHFYILGRLDNDKVVLGDSIITKHAEFFLPFLNLIVVSVARNSILVGILGTIVWVYTISAYWRLFKIYKPKSRVSYTIWSAILGSGFFIFAIRNERPYDPLEPDKVYENFYGHKRVVQDHYDQMEAEVRKREEMEQARLRDSYENELRKPGLTEEERDRLGRQYMSMKNRIENEADRIINEQKTEERADIYELDKNKAVEVDETDVYKDHEKRPQNLSAESRTEEIPKDVYIEEDIIIAGTTEDLEKTEDLDKTTEFLPDEDDF